MILGLLYSAFFTERDSIRMNYFPNKNRK